MQAFNYEILRERPEQYEAIADVLREAFDGEDEVQLVEAIRKGDTYLPKLSLVAIQHGDVIGYIQLSTASIQTASGDIPVLALAPLAVLPEYQQQGIGKRLVRRALQLARENDATAVMVLGDPEYYGRFGFQPASQWSIQPPDPAWGEHFQAIELVAGSLSNAQGTMHYDAAWNHLL